jgi:hypothetical protein
MLHIFGSRKPNTRRVIYARAAAQLEITVHAPWMDGAGRCRRVVWVGSYVSGGKVVGSEVGCWGMNGQRVGAVMWCVKDD